MTPEDQQCHTQMSGQIPIFWAPTNCIVDGGHKPAGRQRQLHHHPNLGLEAMLSAASRGPLMPALDYKEAIQHEEGRLENQTMDKPQAYHGHAFDILPCMRDLYSEPGPAAGRTGERLDVSMEEEEEQEDLRRGEEAEYNNHEEEVEGGVEHMLVTLMKESGSRRLGYAQVRCLEKAFEVDKRLDTARKASLASQLGLQPRQVAVWFQNRRARSKSKQLERDYRLLNHKFEALTLDRDQLLQEIHHLRLQLARLNGQSSLAVDQTKSKSLASEGNHKKCPPFTLASIALHPEKKLLLLHGGDSLSTSTTEDSDIHNDGAIQDSLQEDTQPPISTSKSFHGHDPDCYSAHHECYSAHHECYSAHHDWRLPTQLLYKPTYNNEECRDHTMHAFNMPTTTTDTWYLNW